MKGRIRSRRAVRFGDFVADLHSGELHKNGTRLKLQEKPFKILQLLLERAGQIVTRDELRENLWPTDTFVDFNHGINVAVAKIREVLGESSEHPKFLHTVGRRGYRFVGAVEQLINGNAARGQTSDKKRIHVAAESHSVGRERERAQLAASFESAEGGRGLLVSVGGEPGIGKTTLVQDFLLDLQANGESFGLAVGRCSQRLAGEEAYLPLLEALESLLRNDNPTRQKLRAMAPSWYAQLFPLSENDPADARLQEYVRTTTQERVKRELAAFFHEVTREKPLVLFFDDLHWSDLSTLDLLAHLATRFDGMRILVIATYRATELFLSKHPFIGVKRELLAHGLARDIEVEFLSSADVQRYIAVEFPDNRFPSEFAGVIHSRTEGNPLFMVDLLRYLRDRQVIVEDEGQAGWNLAQSLPDLSRNFPQSISNVIERKIDQVGELDREALTTAAVQGFEFDSAALAGALEVKTQEIEGALNRLERVHALIKRTAEQEFPDGTLTVRYRFVHVLYQNALYASLTTNRRAILSGALARALEGFHGERTSAVASQLGFLYETARDWGRASDFFLLAAMNAQRIFAHQEAMALAQRGLGLLAKMPDTPQRTRKELGLQLAFAFSLIFAQGYGAPEVQRNMARARKLSESLGDRPHLFSILFGLWLYYITAPELHAARRTAEQMLDLANEVEAPILILAARTTLGMALQHLGEIAAAQRELDAALTYHEPARHQSYLELFRMEPGIDARGQTARTLWMLGYPDQARRQSEEAVLLARTIPSPPSLAFALMHAAFLYQHLRQPEKARHIAEECISVCDEHGVAQERAWVSFAHGWAIAELGAVEHGIAQIRAGLDAQISTGGQVARPQFASFLAEIYRNLGRAEEGLKLVEDSLEASQRTNDKYYDAELLRLKGELLKIQHKTPEAECCFQRAIETARQQAAKSLELRAAMSLARLWQKQGKRKEPKKLLGDVYAWFTEGFDTADLKEASSLLEELL